MTINEYQSLAMRTLNPKLEQKDILLNGVMGLCGESGEVIDIVKNIWRRAMNSIRNIWPWNWEMWRGIWRRLLWRSAIRWKIS